MALAQHKTSCWSPAY